MILLWTKCSMDKRTDSMASQLNLAKRNVISLFFLRNGKVIFSGDISFSEPYILFRVVLNTDYTVIVPGWSWHNLSFNRRWSGQFFLGWFQDKDSAEIPKCCTCYTHVFYMLHVLTVCCSMCSTAIFSSLGNSLTRSKKVSALKNIIGMTD